MDFVSRYAFITPEGNKTRVALNGVSIAGYVSPRQTVVAGPVPQVDAVIAYILNQVEHHRKVSFQDEFRLLLDRHGLVWDEKYVWD